MHIQKLLISQEIMKYTKDEKQQRKVEKKIEAGTGDHMGKVGKQWVITEGVFNELALYRKHF